MVAKSPSPSRSSAPNPPTHRFKGVRMRSWGKWVSEIRLPNTRARLWLGSFSTAEQAACAFDVAVICLRGRSATLNFPDSPPSYAPLGLPHHQIQELAAAAAAAAASKATATATAASSPATSIPCEEVRIGPNCEESENAVASSPTGSEELGNATVSYSSSISEDAMANETTTTSSSSSSSRSASCSSNESATFADLLELEAESEQSSPLDAGLQEHALNMGVEWEELMWGLSIPSYMGGWGEELLVLPPLPAEDDVPMMVEPSLWCL